MATKDMNTSRRMDGPGGSMSEKTFESSWPHKWLRSGFANPSWSDGTLVKWDLPHLLTGMPDYIARNGDGPYWVECVGCSGSRVTALKVKKLALLLEWEVYTGMPVVVFVYNSKMRKWVGVWRSTLDLMSVGKPVLEHHDGPEYYDWRWDDLREIAYLEGTKQR